MRYSALKRALFWLILFVVPIAFGVTLVLGWYAYGKLTFTAYFCAPFSKLDDELGWVHKPNFESCMGTHGKFDRTHVYYEYPIYTDENGFRSATVGEKTPQHAVLFIGDSHTFGYMVPYEESFPGWYHRITNEPVVDIGSPAYSGAQAVHLTRRWAKRLKPKALVYFEAGFWERGVCKGKARPTFLMKPCYWTRPDQRAELILPPEGQVESMAAWGLRPGGMVGAGEVTWSYFLLSRPIMKFHQYLVRLGLSNGMEDDFHAFGAETALVRCALLKDLFGIATALGVPLVLIDTDNYYLDAVKSLPEEGREWLVYVDKGMWESTVMRPALKLPKDRFRVPHDGHYAGGTNRLIAELIRSRLANTSE